MRSEPVLLLATFGRLLRFDPSGADGSGAETVVHEGAGKYYGLAPAGEPDVGPAASRLAVVSRPDQQKDDVLLEIDALRGDVVRRRPLRSRDTHQIVRAGRRLFVTDTFRGRILGHDWPSLELRSEIAAFTHENHVNSLLPDGRGGLFAMCHNKGKSFMARVDVASRAVTGRWPDVGENSHDIHLEGRTFVICDSKGGGLVAVDAESRACRTLWSSPGCFTKGLAVQDGVAYFGVSPHAVREERFRVQCDVVAFDLREGRELWRRRVASNGLVNAIATEATLARQFADGGFA
ncbi:MAG: hypothetical protein HMLKMBBP_00361 [Planctomycetes bacterium]|nr:hypothetical protein [Planctomycetota bacterium]